MYIHIKIQHYICFSCVISVLHVLYMHVPDRKKGDHVHVYMYTCIHVLNSKQGQTNKAKQHSTPKAVTFHRKNELAQVGLEPTTLYTLDRALYQLSYRGSSTLDRALYQLSYRGSSAGWAQISHLIVHEYMYMYV